MCGQPVSHETDRRLQGSAIHQTLRMDPAFVKGVVVAGPEVTISPGGFFGRRSGVR
jgi:hypothetical protein